ncbi:inositol monophosphatase family protein [Gryllotalpicola protaetiae]|uniref:Inositol-1-monophosphatase n=1 Tax=Gryllotalpicola protaetiae TaxID=2419771 RepID=A0A387BS73_9MICO|nr:inositol monophosphatase family protein [Gryllotalpicola protaetiae]AYG03856.1 inositol monophosphatase [Gryllotalpicola protaetiae]
MTNANDELLEIARSTAVAAADLVRAKRTAGVAVAALKSSPVDVVTEADRESEDLIRSLLADARPGDGFLGEESGAGDASTTGVTWVVDPIDGTVNYLYDIPAYAVSIAAVEGGSDPAEWTALAGVVVNPVLGEVYAATRGGGAFLGRQRLQVQQGKQLATSLVATGFSYTAERRERQASALTRLIPLIRDIRRAGSAALDLCSVAAGRVDAYYERGLNPWDHAAGALIAAEAGAQVGGLHGAPAGSLFTLAAEPGLFAQLAPLLDEFGAAF